MKLHWSWCLIYKAMNDFTVNLRGPPSQRLIRDCTMMVNIPLTRPYFGETWHWRWMGPLDSHALNMVEQEVKQKYYPNGSLMVSTLRFPS